MADVLPLARRHDAAFNAKDADGRRAIEARDIEFVMPGGISLRGHENVMQVVQAFWEALPDARITPDDLFAAGDTVVASQQLTGGDTAFSIGVPLTQEAANNFLLTAGDAADTLQLESDMGGIAPVDATGVPGPFDAP